MKAIYYFILIYSFNLFAGGDLVGSGIITDKKSNAIVGNGGNLTIEQAKKMYLEDRKKLLLHLRQTYDLTLYRYRKDNLYRKFFYNNYNIHFVTDIKLLEKSSLSRMDAINIENNIYIDTNSYSSLNQCNRVKLLLHEASSVEGYESSNNFDYSSKLINCDHEGLIFVFITSGRKYDKEFCKNNSSYEECDFYRFFLKDYTYLKKPIFFNDYFQRIPKYSFVNIFKTGHVSNSFICDRWAFRKFLYPQTPCIRMMINNKVGEHVTVKMNENYCQDYEIYMFGSPYALTKIRPKRYVKKYFKICSLGSFERPETKLLIEEAVFDRSFKTTVDKCLLCD